MKTMLKGISASMLMFAGSYLYAQGQSHLPSASKGAALVKTASASNANNQVIVKMKPGKHRDAMQTLSTLRDKVKTFKHFDDLVVLTPPEGTDRATFIKSLRADPNVAFVETDFTYSAHQTIPVDTNYLTQWGLNNIGQSGGTFDADINAPEAWDITTGSDNVVVAVLDTGIDYNHPDLVDNLWVNLNEIPNNSIDDDANGYIDDIHGINAIAESGDPFDNDGHGTHVAGIIGARGNNNTGVTGVNWNVKILSCNFLGTGEGNTSDAIKCLDYLIDLKNRVVNPVNIVVSNNSWGGEDESLALRTAIEESINNGILFVASAGNEGLDNDRVPSYPASFELNGIISVAATDRNDQLAEFSNYGQFSVDVGAPGVSILSTVPNSVDPSGYAFFNGTSMAAPHVAGLAALLVAQDPSRDVEALKNLILSSGTTTTALLATTVTGKRIRAADNDGSGAMTCINQVVTRNLKPGGTQATVLRNGNIDVTALGIDCENSFLAFNAMSSASATDITFRNDGNAPDTAAQDHLLAASIPVANDTTLTFPAGNTLSLKTVKNYQAPTVVSFNYRNISGTNLELDDDDVAQINSPFPIHFGAVNDGFTQLNVSSNGLLSFTSNTIIEFENAALPQTIATDVIAPYWDDLDPEFDGDVVWSVQGIAPNRELVIEWQDVVHFDSLDGISFQVVFFEASSDVLFNYLDVNFDDQATLSAGASATIGIQTHFASGEEFSFDQTSITNQMSLLWQTVNTLPQANAGLDQAADSGDVVQLQGVATDDDGEIISAQWQQISGTTVSAVQTGNNLSFTAPNTTATLTFQFSATDNDGAAATDTVSVMVTGTTPTPPPVAPSSSSGGGGKTNLWFMALLVASLALGKRSRRDFTRTLAN